MPARADRHNSRIVFIALSVLIHALFLFAQGVFGKYEFGSTVGVQPIVVDLTAERDVVPVQAVPPATEADDREDKSEIPLPANAGVDKSSGVAPEGPQQVEPLVTPAGSEHAESEAGQEPTNKPVAELPPSRDVALIPPLMNAKEFMGPGLEKLTFQLRLMGLPVGSAELEGKNERGEIRISLKVKSNQAMSGLYQIDDMIETRHLAGNYIISKIKRQEGSYRNEKGFTIFLRDKKVFWIDLLKRTSITETVPHEGVLDVLSALYYLRNKPLEVGSSELLDIYDSDAYVALPVEVLRREQVSLPGLKTIEAVVVRSVLKNGGLFKTAGDLVIWLTDDQNRVPVKIETQCPFGKLTAVLVSSETEKNDADTPAKPVQARTATPRIHGEAARSDAVKRQSVLSDGQGDDR